MEEARPATVRRDWDPRFWLGHIPDLFTDAEKPVELPAIWPRQMPSEPRYRLKTAPSSPRRKSALSKRGTSAAPETTADPVSTLHILWEETLVGKRNTELFLSCLDDLPEEKAFAVLNFEVQQTRQGVSLLQKIARTVAQREETVSLLHYLGDLYAQTPGLLSRAEARKCAEVIARVRLYSLQVVEGIEKWKGFLSSLLALQAEKQGLELVYRWENEDYLAKMRADLDFLCDSPIGTCFAFAPSDPFLMLCSHCGSAPQYSQASRLVHLPSDSGKHLVPVPRAYQGRMRLAEVIVLEGVERPEVALPAIGQPVRPNGGRFSISVRRNTPPKEPPSPQVDPKMVAERVLDGVITAFVSEELRFLCQDAALSTRTAVKAELSGKIAEKYIETMVVEGLISAVQSGFEEFLKAKLVLHSSTILDSIVLESIRGEIPLIALEALREEKARAEGAAADRYVQDLISAQIRATVAETVRDWLISETQERLLEEGLRRELRAAAREEVEDYERLSARPIEELVEAELSEFSAEESPPVPTVVVIPEKLPVSQAEQAENYNVEDLVAEDLLNHVLDEEFKDYLEGKIAKNAAKAENERQFLSSEVGKSLLSQVLSEFDYYSIAEEMAFSELSTSPLPLTSKTALLEQWRVERLCREVYAGLVQRWSEEGWLFTLCQQQFQQACQTPKLHLSNSQLRLEDRIDYVMETYTSSMHSPKSYIPGVSPALETYSSPSPSEPCFPDAAKLDALLAFATEVELEVIEAWEDALPRIVFTYMQLLQPPMDSLVTSAETLLRTMQSSLNPQWYWLLIEGKAVGLVCFREDEGQSDRVVCEHFSVLDFRYWEVCVDEVLRWALRDYNEVRLRVYFESAEPSQYKTLLAAKGLKWKRVWKEEGLLCMEMGKSREGELLNVFRGLVFEHSTLVDPKDLELVLSGMFGTSELSAELMELEGLKYLQLSEGRLQLSGRLRLLGSECRLLPLLGRLCRCIRVQAQVKFT